MWTCRPPAQAALIPLHSFTRRRASTLEAKLILGTDGDFYGTTVNGGLVTGVKMFRMTPAGAVTTLVSFAGSNGSSPYAAVMQVRTGISTAQPGKAALTSWAQCSA